MTKAILCRLGTTSTKKKVTVPSFFEPLLLYLWIDQWNTTEQVDIYCMLEVAILKFFKNSQLIFYELNSFSLIFHELSSKATTEGFKTALIRVKLVSSLDRVRYGKTMVSETYKDL